MDIIDLSELGVYEYPISKKNMCHEDPRGFIIDTRKKRRCILVYSPQKIVGGYGILQFALRNNEQVLIKGPLYEGDSFINEGLIQYYSYKILEKYNLQFSIPKVYEIFLKSNSIYLCMEYLETITFDTFLLESKQQENDLLYSLLQVCIILNILENKIYFNHRDLRITNILILKKPVSYTFNYSNKKYSMQTSFLICLIYFGFACIGKEKTTMNANEKLFSNNVKCLKDGRDIFQLLVSIWSIKEIRDKVNESFKEKINVLLNHPDNIYSNLPKWKEYINLEETKWTYTFTGCEDFCMKHLKPKHLIGTLIELLDLEVSSGIKEV
jgi:serine/threonine protein kinase